MSDDKPYPASFVGPVGPVHHSDIVTRLRNLGWETCHEAADQLERLGALATVVREQGFEIERLQHRLNEVDAQLTAEDHIHARETMALRAEKDAEIEQLQALLREALLYGDLIGPMESWWRKARKAMSFAGGFRTLPTGERRRPVHCSTLNGAAS